MFSESTVLVVGGTPDERENILRTLGDNFRVVSAETINEALEHSNDSVELVICNLESQHASCLELIRSWHSRHPDAPFVMLTDGHDVHGVVEAMKQGALDCIVKPLDADELRSVVERIVDDRRSNSQEVHSKSLQQSKGGIDIPPGTSLEDLERAAVEQALSQHHGNRTHAAKTLGISVRTLQRKLKAWGIPVMPFQGSSPDRNRPTPAHGHSRFAFGAPVH